MTAFLSGLRSLGKYSVYSACVARPHPEKWRVPNNFALETSGPSLIVGNRLWPEVPRSMSRELVRVERIVVGSLPNLRPEIDQDSDAFRSFLGSWLTPGPRTWGDCYYIRVTEPVIDDADNNMRNLRTVDPKRVLRVLRAAQGVVYDSTNGRYPLWSGSDRCKSMMEVVSLREFSWMATGLLDERISGPKITIKPPRTR